MPDPKDKPKPQVSQNTTPIGINAFDGEEDTYKGQLPNSEHYTIFSPKDYTDVKSASPFDDRQSLHTSDSRAQSTADMWTNASKQLGANILASLGQELANTVDVDSNVKTAQGLFGDSTNDFNSSFLGLFTSRDAQNFANSVAQNNPIKERNEGSFSPSDPAWWAKQIASTGTGIGMAVGSLGETLAIESLTGGAGTAAALGKLGSLGKRLFTGIKGTEALAESMSIAKGLRSAATMYGVMSRLGESNMEAMNTYDQVYSELGNQTKPDGSAFTEQEKKEYATKGANRDYMYNLALLPLDILSYRTMVFNPVSGAAGEGWYEKGLEKLASLFGESKLGKAAGWTAVKTLGIAPEGGEEGEQQIGQDEGMHYAKVLAGLDDGKGFGQRLSDEFKTDEFWNNVAGGLIGAPVIGGAMNVVNSTLHGKAQARQNRMYKNFVDNVGKADFITAAKIKAYEQAGDMESANAERANHVRNQAIRAKHLDAITGKDSATQSLNAFLSGTLDELKAGKTDALKDLGINTDNMTPEALKANQDSFEGYLKDANQISAIYDSIKDKYNKNYLPVITRQHFNLSKLGEAKTDNENFINQKRGNLFGYNELSDMGKQVFDTEYQLRALQYEGNRLQGEEAKTDDEDQKNNISKLIKENKEAVDNIKANIESINKNPMYATAQRESDRDIIDSSIIDKGYSQAIYNRQRYDNEISLLRKNISLWNSPAYQKRQAETIIKKAPTVEQVQDAADNLKTQQNGKEQQPVSPQTAPGINTPVNPSPVSPVSTVNEVDVDKLAADRQTQILSQEAADALNNNTQTEHDNDPLFDMDDSFANDIADAANYTDVGGGFVNHNEPDDPNQPLFSPKVFDFDKSPNDAKEKIKRGVQGIVDNLGDAASFEDVVRRIAKVKGNERAEEMFNALKWGWEAIGKPKAAYQEVYDKLFGHGYADMIDAGVSELTPQATTTQTEVITDAAIHADNPPQQFDEDNQPIVIKHHYATNQTSPKLAFLTKFSRVRLVETEDGIEVQHHDEPEEVLDTIDSLPLLDPDKFVENTGITIKVPASYQDLLVPVYNADGTKGRAVTFKQYVAERGLKETDQEYKDKIPMIVYRKGAPEDEKGVALVHDIHWYNDINFRGTRDEMAEAVKSTRAIRDEVLSNNNQTDGIITGKKQTTFEDLKIPMNEPKISVWEANPQARIAIGGNDGNSLMTNLTTRMFPNDNETLANSKEDNILEGQVYSVVRYGLKEGKPTFMALPVDRDNLSPEQVETIMQAIIIYSNRNNQNQVVRKTHEAARQKIIDTMGVDIMSTRGIESFLSHYISVFRTNGRVNEAEVERQALAKYKDRNGMVQLGRPYITFLPAGTKVVNEKGVETTVPTGGNIVFGQVGIKGNFFINPDSSTIGKGLGKLREQIKVDGKTYPNFFSWFKQNVDYEALAKNKPVVQIDKNAQATVAHNSYQDMIKKNVKTNIRSMNIGTKENPNYVTNVQPLVTYDTNKRLRENQGDKTNEQIKQEITTQTIVPAAEETAVQPREEDTSITAEDKIKKQELEDKKKALLEKAKSKLGRDLGSSKQSFAPVILTDEQANSLPMERIPGINVTEQEQIIDFMLHRIAQHVADSGGTATVRSANEAVDNAFNQIIKPQIEELETYKSEIEEVLKELPDSELESAVADTNIRLAKIRSVMDNLSQIKKMAKEKLEKETSISSTREAKDGTDIDDNNDTGEEPNDRLVDFWTDILAETPEHKITKEIRSFFRGIERKDAEGETLRGVLDLPLYENPHDMVRKLMQRLADTPADFNSMIGKLEKDSKAMPWLSQVVAKLKAADNQKRQQFITAMANTSLRSKFTMMSYDRRTSTWKTEVYDTAITGIADSIKDDWKANFFDRDLVMEEEGMHQLNVARAQHILQTYNTWIGVGLTEVPSNLLEPYWEGMVKQVSPSKPATLKPTGELAKFLQANIKDNNGRVRFSLRNNQYQITKAEDGYTIETFKKATPTQEEVGDWLKEFGIDLQPETLKELMTIGLNHNRKLVQPKDMFNQTSGLVGILAKKLSYLVDSHKDGATVSFDEPGNNPLEEGVVSSLSVLESSYNDEVAPFAFRDGGKSYFALTAPKFVTDRARELKGDAEKLREQLASISFSSPSMWLRALQDGSFRKKFGVFHLGQNALKQMGKKLYRDAAITKLSDLDHELTKVGMFQDTKQGKYTYETTGLTEYPNSGIQVRMATIFNPTHSDKDLATLINTVVLALENKDLRDGNGISSDLAKVLFDQLVRPELLRMIKYHQNVKNGVDYNIKDYEKGAGLFNFLPELNNFMVTPELRLIDAIKNNPETYTMDKIEGDSKLKGNILGVIGKYVEAEVERKLDSWNRSGIVTYDKENPGQASFKYFNGAYMTKFHGAVADKIRMAAMDYAINSMIANANSFMLFAGDPALYYKSKEKSSNLKKVQDSFVNVGKRLALMIAPGTTIADSEDDHYIQVFLKDRESMAEGSSMEYLESLVKDGYLTEAQIKGYRAIEATDAQEYTTWKEHLDVLERLGKIPDIALGVTPEEIVEARKIFSENKPLDDRQKDLVKRVAQPIKPVYTGQIHDSEKDVMRTIYIKSSSFPLIPQLTAGLEIDKLRELMESMQEGAQLNVRASYQSANKVGAVNKPLNIWDENGNFDMESVTGGEEEAGDNVIASHLLLDRKNFRIQMEVPFKEDSHEKTLGTQLMKLLFGDNIMNLDGFNYNGESLSGTELYHKYNNAFAGLLQEKQNQLYSELGLDEQGNPKDEAKTQAKLQDLLIREAKDRKYPVQSLEGLELKDGKFVLPLWNSATSDRFESMLNSIVSNRLVKMKLPGAAGVVASEEGFRKAVTENPTLEGIDKSKIIFTSGWQGELKATRLENGELKYAQVLAQSKFTDNNGNTLDLLQKKDGKYVYITETKDGFRLKENMFDKELLQRLAFRVPSSGHQSGSLIEIVGFLPYESADTLITPKNFTKQMGQDFDIDKANMYMLQSFMTSEGKLEVLAEKHRSQMLTQAETEKINRDRLEEIYEKYKGETGVRAQAKMREEIKAELANQRLTAKMLGDVEFTEDDIEDSGLSKLNSKINEKLFKNEIVRITQAVFANPNPEVQAKILKTLNTDFAEDEADYIDGLSVKADQTYWTPLSDEYQKGKMFLGAGGKLGTAAYSLDVVFHSLAQQAANIGNPLSLRVKQTDPITGHEEYQDKTWRFGNTKDENGEYKYTTRATLGGEKTTKGTRSVSDVLAERQNIAVDNEKLQVMGRVNLNDITIDVDKLLNMVGIDEGEDGHSISMLFLSQPIIKEYVALMRNANSIMADFEANKTAKIIEGLYQKYYPQGYMEGMMDIPEEEAADMMGNDNLAEGISTNGADGKLQAAVLRRFLEMMPYGNAIKTLQSAINFKGNSLGKSFFDVIEKRDSLNRLATNLLVKNATALIGDYIDIAKAGGQIDELKKQGYVDIGNYLVKPTTVVGNFNIKGTITAYEMWKKFFPYNATAVKEIFDDLLPIFSIGDNLGTTKKVETKQEIFRGIKRYIAASKRNNIISSTDDISTERHRIYIDTEENTSLAKYLKTLSEMQGNSAVNVFIKNNSLLNRFKYDIKKNGDPSLIKYNNAAGEEFDEQYLYDALTQLLSQRDRNGNRIELPQVGNKKYTLDTLAQDLIAYTYLGNAVQEAIQFTKYIPVSYLNAVGYSERLRWVESQLPTNSAAFGIRLGKGSDAVDGRNAHMVREASMQIAQHLPERIKSPYRDKESFMKAIIGDTGDITTLTTFTLKPSELSNPPFISVYDPKIPKGEKKYRLYWFDGAKYVKIPVLGAFGMDEYQPGNNGFGQSLVNGRVRVKAQPQEVIAAPSESGSATEQLLNIHTGDLNKVLDSITKNNLGGYSALARELAKYQGTLGDITIQWEAGKLGLKYEGLYMDDGHIYIDPSMQNKPAEYVAKIVLHEVIHGLTKNQISQWIEATVGNTKVKVKEGAPAYVSNLVRLYNMALESGNKERIEQVLSKISAKEGMDLETFEKYYGLSDIYEFMSMAITEPKFQEALNKIETADGQTLWEKFKGIISEILTKLGVNVKSDSVLAEAFNSIFELIDDTNTTQHREDLNAQMWEQGFGFDEEGGMIQDWGDEGAPDFSEFPSKFLDIQEQACM